MINRNVLCDGLYSRPSPKLSAGTAAAAISAASALGSSLLSNAVNANLNSKNRKWQERQNEIARQYQRDEWDRQFGIITDYDLPVNQAKRLLQAGINPSVAFEGTQTSALSGENATIPPASFSGSPSSIPFQLNGGAFARDVASAVKEMVESAKGAKELPLVQNHMQAEIDRMLSDAKYNDVRSEAQAFATTLEKAYRGQYMSKGLEQLNMQMAETYANIQLAIAQTDLAKADEGLTKLKQLTEYWNSRIGEQKNNQLALEVQYMPQELEARINELRSRANLANESANDLRMTRDSRIAVNNAVASLDNALANESSIRGFIADETKYAHINHELQQLKNLKLINNKLIEDVEIARKQNNYERVRQLLEIARTAAQNYYMYTSGASSSMNAAAAAIR